MGDSVRQAIKVQFQPAQLEECCSQQSTRLHCCASQHNAYSLPHVRSSNLLVLCLAVQVPQAHIHLREVPLLDPTRHREVHLVATPHPTRHNSSRACHPSRDSQHPLVSVCAASVQLTIPKLLSSTLRPAVAKPTCSTAGACRRFVERSPTC